MPKTVIIEKLLQYLPEHRKELSVVDKTFRDVFLRSEFMASMSLVVYSVMDMRAMSKSVDLFSKVRHLHLVVLPEGSEGNADAKALKTVKDQILCAVYLIRESKLLSFSVTFFGVALNSTDNEQSEETQPQLKIAIPLEQLDGLTYLNLYPFHTMNKLFLTLISRPNHIETLEFRSRPPRWLVSCDSSKWSAMTCCFVSQRDLKVIRNNCRCLRRLLGVRVDEFSLLALEEFAQVAIELTDVYLVHDDIEEFNFREFLLSQPSLINVHIENTKSCWTPAPTSLYSIAKNSLPNLRKFDVFGLPSAGQRGKRDISTTVSEMSNLTRVRLEKEMEYNMTDPFALRRIKLFCTEKLESQMPWSVVKNLSSLQLINAVLTHHNVQLVHSMCPSLRHLHFRFCQFESEKSLVFLSNMQNLVKLTVFSCRFMKMLTWYCPFAMPQLRRLSVYADFSDQDQRIALAFVSNAPNIVQLKLIDTSAESDDAEDDGAERIGPLMHLRWLTTNVYKGCEDENPLDLTNFPLLQGLCIVPRHNEAASKLRHRALYGSAEQNDCHTISVKCLRFAVGLSESDLQH